MPYNYIVITSKRNISSIKIPSTLSTIISTRSHRKNIFHSLINCKSGKYNSILQSFNVSKALCSKLLSSNHFNWISI